MATNHQEHQPDCIVIGSSHVMLVGSSRPQKSLTGLCNTILNLSVSGAGLEDQLALTHLTLMKDSRPQKLILEIAPWTFAFGKDLRWSNAYPDDYYEMLRILGTTDELATQRNYAESNNLINLQYTKESLKKLYKILISEYDKEITEAPPLQEDTGGKHAVIFPDGSLLYSAKYYKSAGQKVRLGGDTYKTESQITDPIAINTYVQLLKWVMAQGIEPMLMMTPYHPNVLAYPDTDNSKAIKQTESAVNAIRSDLNLRIIGSFNPIDTKCNEDEFMDFMHARISCISKLSIH